MRSTGADVHISVHGEFAKEPMDSAISIAVFMAEPPQEPMDSRYP